MHIMDQKIGLLFLNFILFCMEKTTFCKSVPLDFKFFIYQIEICILSNNIW